jgi:hypothetical protein
MSSAVAASARRRQLEHATFATSKPKTANAVTAITTSSNTAASLAIAKILADVPESTKRNPNSFTRTLLNSGGAAPMATAIPPTMWKMTEAELPWAERATNGARAQHRAYPATEPTSRADVFYAAAVMDEMNADDAVAPANMDEPEAAQRRCMDVLLCGLTEVARQSHSQVAERGVLVVKIRDAVAALFERSLGLIAQHRRDAEDARALVPAQEVSELHSLLFQRDLQLKAARRCIDDLRAEMFDAQQTAASVDAMRSRQGVMQKFVARQAERNAALMQIEEQRLQSIVDAGGTVGDSDVASSSSSDSEIEVFHADRAVQVTLDQGYDDNIVSGIHQTCAEMQRTMGAISTLCAPFYTTAGIEDLSRAATVALARLQDMSQRALDLDERRKAALDVGGGHFVAGRELLAGLVRGCFDSAKQVRIRVAALAERTDIRKLAGPMKPPTDDDDPCPLCGRLEMGHNPVAAAELEAAVAQVRQQTSSIELLRAERAVLHEELDRANARLLRRAGRMTHQETMTASNGAIAAPLELQLNINCSCTTQGFSRRASRKSMSKGSKGFAEFGDSSPAKIGDADDAGARMSAPARRASMKFSELAQRKHYAETGRRMIQDGDDAASPGPTSRSQKVTFTSRDEPNSDDAIASPTSEPGAKQDYVFGSPRGSTADSGAADAAGPFSGSARRLRTGTDARASVAAAHAPLGSRGSANSLTVGAAHKLSAQYTSVVSSRKASSQNMKPVSWLLRIISQMYHARAKLDVLLADDDKALPSCSAHVVDFLRSTMGTKKLVTEAIVSVNATTAKYRYDDPRVSLFADFVNGDVMVDNVADVYGAVVSVSRHLDDTASIFAPGADSGDYGRHMAVVPLRHALHAVTLALGDKPFYMPLVLAMIDASFVANGTCLPVPIDLDKPPGTVPKDALFRKIVRWQLLHVVRALVVAEGNAVTQDMLSASNLDPDAEMPDKPPPKSDEEMVELRVQCFATFEPPAKSGGALWEESS